MIRCTPIAEGCVPMSDLSSDNTRSELEEFYHGYAPRRFPTAKTKRAEQNIAKQLKLPLIRCGNTMLIDPRMGDDTLRKLAQHQSTEQPERRRGRPRAV